MDDLLAFGSLLVAHHLELVDLLQLGDLEGAVGLTGLHLEVVDLHVPLPDLVLLVELLTEHGAALLVKLLAEGGEVILAHAGDVGEGANLGENGLGNTHDAAEVSESLILSLTIVNFL